MPPHLQASTLAGSPHKDTAGRNSLILLGGKQFLESCILVEVFETGLREDEFANVGWPFLIGGEGLLQGLKARFGFAQIILQPGQLDPNGLILGNQGNEL